MRRISLWRSDDSLQFDTTRHNCFCFIVARLLLPLLRPLHSPQVNHIIISLLRHRKLHDSFVLSLLIESLLNVKKESVLFSFAVKKIILMYCFLSPLSLRKSFVCLPIKERNKISLSFRNRSLTVHVWRSNIHYSAFNELHSWPET